MKSYNYTGEDKNLRKMEIKGRVALITGAASGIGKAYAIELLNQGAKVTICDINTEEGEKLVETLAAKHGKDRVIFSQCDVTDYPQFEESFQTTIAEFGHIDIVINNAGIMNDRFWELEVDINLNGIIRGTLLAQRFMGTDRGGQGGVVINTGSNTSINPYVSVPIYSATKAAIVSFTRAFGDQYHVDLTGVKVMALCPGATDTKLVRDVNRKLLLARYEDAWQKDIVSSIPQRTEHVAKALVHVLSTGKSGSVWMVEKDQPPHEISFTKH
ncbi:15-hydroxyprostaglandin dehydrogenase [NAD(+)]-like isoform X1 [Temnothorax curvispinosus]|nr:15-hydroxyprostaglandin dehydrogenase [NAD(+)]-like isoform X1 [Temnothorax curvispinosus]